MNKNKRDVFVFLRLSSIIAFLAFTLFVSSSDLYVRFLAHAQVAKNTTILPTAGSNATNITSLAKSNITTTAAGPNSHKYEGGSTAGVGGE
jgi:hypothetical protein